MTAEEWVDAVLGVCAGDERMLLHALELLDAVLAGDDFRLLRSLVRQSLTKVVASAG